MAVPDPEAASPRVLGVDDFAIRRGQHYGTLLIDCETGGPLDLLQGRDAQPFADWLAAHPGVEVICRSRSGSFADGARTGAPQAVQVADRFHLWQNLAKAVEKCVAAHRGCLTEPAPEAAGDPVPPAGTAGETAPEPAGKFAERTRRNHTLVHALRAEGRGLREIARHLSWGLHSVQRYDRAATWQELVDGRWKAPRASKLDPFKPYLDQHAGQGHGSFTRLFREIRDLGYDGSYSVVRNYLDQIRPARTPLPQAPPTVRDVTNWLTRRPDSLTGDEKPRLTAILDRCPELQTASDQVRAFAGILTELTGQAPVDRRCQRRRAARHLVVRQGAETGPGRRHQRPDHALEFRTRRRPGQPHQDDQAPDVRTRRPAAAPQACPARCPELTAARTLASSQPEPVYGAA